MSLAEDQKTYRHEAPAEADIWELEQQMVRMMHQYNSADLKAQMLASDGFETLSAFVDFLLGEGVH